MTKAKSKRKPAAHENGSKTKTRNSRTRMTAHKTGQARSIIKPAIHRRPRSASQPTARRESKKALIIAMLRAPGGVTMRQWHVPRSGNPIRSAASSPVSCARSSASLLSRQTARTGVFTGLWIARRQRRRSAMKRTRPVAKKATRLSLDDEIAHLRDLDLHGLRARWKSTFRRQPLPHLPRHLLFAVLAYRLQADEWVTSIPPPTVLRQIATDEGPQGPRAGWTRSVAEGLSSNPARSWWPWNAQSYRAGVVSEGFAWNGTIYNSLSKVAFAITGTNWNGPRFFGLRDKILLRPCHDGGR